MGWDSNAMATDPSKHPQILPAKKLARKNKRLKELLTGYKNAPTTEKKERVVKNLQEWITTQAKDMDDHEKHLEFVKSLKRKIDHHPTAISSKWWLAKRWAVWFIIKYGRLYKKSLLYKTKFTSRNKRNFINAPNNQKILSAIPNSISAKQDDGCPTNMFSNIKIEDSGRITFKCTKEYDRDFCYCIEYVVAHLGKEQHFASEDPNIDVELKIFLNKDRVHFKLLNSRGHPIDVTDVNDGNIDNAFDDRRRRRLLQGRDLNGAAA